MKNAFSIVPHRFEDGRWQAIEQGIRELGFSLHSEEAWRPRPRQDYTGDVMLTWNLHGDKERARDRFEAQGGRVIVFEEGYTRGIWEAKHFAASLHGHNGSGTWLPEWHGAADEGRWLSLAIPFTSWREDGGHVLVCGQRGIGSSLMASPPEWHNRVAERLREYTSREIVVRTHPGKDKAARATLDDQLAGAWACVIWSSGCGVRALLHGIPVIREAPHWILEGAAGFGIQCIEDPPTPDRLEAFARMAWAQWTIEEIRRGDVYRHLLAI